MNDPEKLPISVQPVISYPREAEIGKTYLMEIDLKQTGDFGEWTYEEEEYPIYFRVDTYSDSREDTTAIFKIKTISEPAVILHRFGGTYGAAKFLLTAASKEMKGEIRVTLVNGWGVSLKMLRLEVVSIAQEGNKDDRVADEKIVIIKTPKLELFEFKAEVATITLEIEEKGDIEGDLYPGVLVRRDELSASSTPIACFVRKRNQPEIFLLAVSHTLAPNEQDHYIGDPIRIENSQDEYKTIAIICDCNYSLDTVIARIQSRITIQPTKLPEQKSLKGFLTREKIVTKLTSDSPYFVYQQSKISGLIRGSINALEMRFPIIYSGVDSNNNPLKRSFENMIEIEGEGEQPFSQSGDSGSLVFDKDGYAIGIIIAGSNQGGKNNQGLTYAMPIETILNALDLELVLDDGVVDNELSHFVFEIVTVNASGQELSRQTTYSRYFTELLTKDIILEMVAIPGGTFTMGSPENEKDSRNNERPQHNVTVPPFFIGKYPITQAQWQAIASRTDLKVKIDLDEDPSYFKEPYQKDQETIERWQRPVENVNWYEAVEFCQRLSKLTRRDYRLPSEAQWEYACRAMTEPLDLAKGESYQPFYFGETLTDKLANYNASRTYADEPKGEGRNETTPVGQFPPNAFGLYDMHGNVWEWCMDDWHDNYDGAPTDGSAWLDNNQEENLDAENSLESTEKDENNPYSVMRGGSWFNYPRYCRSAYRYSLIRRGNRYGNLGFRVVCVFGRTL
ncbi:MAG: SUMF1/EgtB/PvdO family nonheme iron enzyme [Dolichospermum sp.]